MLYIIQILNNIFYLKFIFFIVYKVSFSYNIISKAVDKLLSVDVILTTESSSFGVRAEDMPYVDTWEDSDVNNMVNDWLIQFEV